MIRQEEIIMGKRQDGIARHVKPELVTAEIA